MVTKTLGEVVKDTRERLGLSQGELADRCRVSRGWLSRVETGGIYRPDRERLEDLERELDLPDGALLVAAGYRAQALPARPRDLEGVLREALAIVQDLKRRGITLGEDGQGDSTSQNFSFEKSNKRFDPTFVYT